MVEQGACLSRVFDQISAASTQEKAHVVTEVIRRASAEAFKRAKANDSDFETRLRGDDRDLFEVLTLHFINILFRLNVELAHRKNQKGWDSKDQYSLDRPAFLQAKNYASKKISMNVVSETMANTTNDTGKSVYTGEAYLFILCRDASGPTITTVNAMKNLVMLWGCAGDGFCLFPLTTGGVEFTLKFIHRGILNDMRLSATVQRNIVLKQHSESARQLQTLQANVAAYEQLARGAEFGGESCIPIGIEIGTELGTELGTDFGNENWTASDSTTVLERSPNPRKRSREDAEQPAAPLAPTEQPAAATPTAQTALLAATPPDAALLAATPPDAAMLAVAPLNAPPPAGPAGRRRGANNQRATPTNKRKWFGHELPFGVYQTKVQDDTSLFGMMGVTRKSDAKSVSVYVFYLNDLTPDRWEDIKMASVFMTFLMKTLRTQNADFMARCDVIFEEFGPLPKGLTRDKAQGMEINNYIHQDAVRILFESSALYAGWVKENPGKQFRYPIKFAL